MDLKSNWPEVPIPHACQKGSRPLGTILHVPELCPYIIAQTHMNELKTEHPQYTGPGFESVWSQKHLPGILKAKIKYFSLHDDFRRKIYNFFLIFLARYRRSEL